MSFRPDLCAVSYTHLDVYKRQPQMTQVPYNSALTSAKFRTELVSNDEKAKYNELVGMVDKSTRKQLNIMLKNGTLLNADSNDKSTTLDNLYKIAKNKRAQGLDSATILKNTIDTISDPHIITCLLYTSRCV